MQLLEFLHRQKLFVHYLTIIVVLIGLAVLTQMRRETRPNVNFYRVAVAVAYPGASASDIEELVIDPIEEKIAEVDGIEEYRSVSYSGAGAISVVIDDEYPNPEEVVEELKQKISEARDIPQEVEDPLVTEIKATNIPVVRIALFGNLTPFEMKFEVEKLKDYLLVQPGVQSVDDTGIKDLQLKILAEPQKLNQYDVTLLELVNQVSQWARQKPGGLFEGADSVANVTVGSDYNEIEELKAFVVRSNELGQSITLSDIADIHYDTESSQSGTLFGDQDAILLTVIKKPFADIVTTVDDIKSSLSKYEEKLPEGLNLKLYTDGSQRVRDKLSIVINNAISGLLMVLILLIIFLDWRSAAVTTIGIPVAVLGGFIVLSALGHTMNSLVVVGVIIVLGMLVDDAIVVCENIYRYIETGASPREAAIQGVREIAIPVVASVCTTIFAFLPIVFMKEIIGQFLRVIPITVISLLAISLVEALWILPVHAEEIMKARGQKKGGFFLRLEGFYESYLQWSIKWRWAVTGVVTLFIGLSFLQGKQVFERFSLFPAVGLEGLSVRVELEKGTPIAKTKAVIKALSTAVTEVSEGTFDSIYSDIGQVTTGGASGSRQNGSHLGAINVVFTTSKDFIDKEKRVVRAIKNVVSTFEKERGIKATVTLDRPGPPIGKPIQIQVATRDIEFGSEIVEQIKAKLASMPGVVGLETDLDGDTTKYRFVVDSNTAVATGVTLANISTTIFAATSGRVSAETLKNNEKIEILVGLKENADFKIKDILGLEVTNSAGQSVNLKSLVKLVEEKGASSIQRLNGLRTITLFGEVEESVISGKQANEAIRPLLEDLKKQNPTARIITGGGEKDRLKAVEDTMRLYILALILIFMVISLSFQSVIYPFFVLLAIPFGVCGVVWSLVAHGVSLSIMGIIGVIGLSGVVVNVSILLLKFIQDGLKAGGSLEEAIISAGKARLRPIFITTVTTLLGLAPTIYGLGGVDTFVQPIALVLGWGLFVSTGMTLLALPAVLSFFTFLEQKPTREI